MAKRATKPMIPFTGVSLMDKMKEEMEKQMVTINSQGKPANTEGSQDKPKGSAKKEKRGPRIFTPVSKDVKEWITARAKKESIAESSVAAHLLYKGFLVECQEEESKKNGNQ
jgi:hypothetical protein